MSGDLNTANVAVLARLRAAGLTEAAELVAKSEGLVLRHVIEVGSEPTGGHIALWRALARRGKDSETLSKLLGWPAQVIAAQLPASPTKKPRVRHELQRQALSPALGMVDVTLESLRSLRAEARAFESRLSAAIDVFERVRSAVDGTVTAERSSQEALAVTHVRAQGDEAGIVERICRETATSVALLLTGSMDRKVAAVRRRCVVALVEAGKSQAATARILGVRVGSIWKHLQVARAARSAA